MNRKWYKANTGITIDLSSVRYFFIDRNPNTAVLYHTARPGAREEAQNLALETTTYIVMARCAGGGATWLDVFSTVEDAQRFIDDLTASMGV